MSANASNLLNRTCPETWFHVQSHWKWWSIINFHQLQLTVWKTSIKFTVGLIYQSQHENIYQWHFRPQFWNHIHNIPYNLRSSREVFLFLNTWCGRSILRNGHTLDVYHIIFRKSNKIKFFHSVLIVYNLKLSWCDCGNVSKAEVSSKVQKHIYRIKPGQEMPFMIDGYRCTISVLTVGCVFSSSHAEPRFNFHHRNTAIRLRRRRGLWLITLGTFRTVFKRHNSYFLIWPLLVEVH